MKKLLGLLSSFALISSTVSVVVACGNNGTRITAPSLNEARAKEVIAKLGENFDFKYSDLFADVDLTTAIVNEINRLVSINYDFSKTDAMLQSLGLGRYELANKTNEKFESRFQNLIKTVAEDKLFNDYSKSVSENTSQALDFGLGKQLYAFNTINDVTETTDVDGKAIYVKAGSIIKIGDTPTSWAIYGENVDGKVTDVSNVPDVAELTQEYAPNGKSAFTIDAYDKADMSGKPTSTKITAKVALSLRFQDYFQNNIMNEAMTNALTMVYNQATMWRIMSKDATANPYIDITNPIFNKTQSWSASDLSTNVKMVWVYTIKGDTYTPDWSSDILDSNGKIQDNTKTSISDIFATLDKTFKKDDTGGNLNKKDGNDPYFGLSGYKGIVVSQDGATIGDNPISGASYEAAVNNKDNLKNSGGITIQNGSLKYFKNADNPDNYDIVITLPIYMMQLLGVEKINGANSDVNVYQVKGADETNEKDARDIQFSRNPDASETFSDIWKYHGIKYQSKDIEDIAKDKVKQESMLQEIEYLVSQEATNQQNAKKVIYSKYLDADDIYYAGLYDQIGSYITKDKSEDE